MKSLIYLFLFSPILLSAQDVNFYVEAPDTVAIGKPFEVAFILKNADQSSQIMAPEFIGLKVVSGPNQSSSMTIINGDVNQSISIRYYLLAEDEGEWVIERAQVDLDGVVYETVPKAIVANLNGPLNPYPNKNSTEDLFGEFQWGELQDRLPFFSERPDLEPEKPKLSKKDSILNKYKVKKF